MLWPGRQVRDADLILEIELNFSTDARGSVLQLTGPKRKEITMNSNMTTKQETKIRGNW